MKAREDEDLMDGVNELLGKKAVASANVDDAVVESLKKLEADRNQSGMLESFAKLNRPMFEGVKDTATRNKSGEVAKRRAKNKLARKTRKSQR